MVKKFEFYSKEYVCNLFIVFPRLVKIHHKGLTSKPYCLWTQLDGSFTWSPTTCLISYDTIWRHLKLFGLRCLLVLCFVHHVVPQVSKSCSHEFFQTTFFFLSYQRVSLHSLARNNNVFLFILVTRNKMKAVINQQMDKLHPFFVPW